MWGKTEEESKTRNSMCFCDWAAITEWLQLDSGIPDIREDRLTFHKVLKSVSQQVEIKKSCTLNIVRWFYSLALLEHAILIWEMENKTVNFLVGFHISCFSVLFL